MAESDSKVPPLREILKGVEITEEDRKNLSPEDLAALERALKHFKENEPPRVKLINPDRFDAKGMHKVGQKLPPRWRKKK